MSSRPNRGRGRRLVRRPGLLAFLAAFLAVDAALIVLAVQHVSGSSTEHGERSQTMIVDVPATGQQRWAADTVMMEAAADGTVLRASPGSCSGGVRSRIGISSDTGATFQRSHPKIARVLAIESVSDVELRIIAAGQDCQVRDYESDDLGATWSRRGAENGWRLDADDHWVRTPQGRSRVGCGIRQVDVVNRSVARLVCVNGTVRATRDSGRTWTRPSALTSVQAISYLTAEVGFAVSRNTTCRAKVYSTRSGGTSWTPQACLDGQTVNAISATPRFVIAAVDGHLLRSVDGGVHWELA